MEQAGNNFLKQPENELKLKKKKKEFSCLHHGLFLFHGCSSKFSWQHPVVLPDQCFISALLLLEPRDQALPLSLCSPHETSKNCSQTMGELNQSCMNSATNLQKCSNFPDYGFNSYFTAFFCLIPTLKKKSQKYWWEEATHKIYWHWFQPLCP